MEDLRTSMIRAHQNNIARYCQLLATDLTESERDYLHKRIAQERAELERWEMQRPPERGADVAAVVAARALDRQDGSPAL
ncbi:MAG TPA: hypothetical protein VFQ27_13375 [Xanthobacteraceae bacterium]|nr:hypothetical protein [Xanthobacteraceae bacterium]